MTSTSGEFETALRRLEEIVAKLERENVGLDESVALFKEGKALALRCEQLLKDAQSSIESTARGDLGSGDAAPGGALSGGAPSGASASAAASSAATANAATSNAATATPTARTSAASTSLFASSAVDDADPDL